MRKNYRFNPHTLAYELHRTPLKVHFSRGFFLFLLTIAAAVGYYQLYTQYFNFETPKMLSLHRKNAELMAKLDLTSRQIREADDRLEQLKVRDNRVYRPIFGMEGIPDEVRNAGFGGVDRYGYLEYSRNTHFLTEIAIRFDQLYKKTGVQSHSFDDVARMTAQADQMAAHIPTILPVNQNDPKFRISSGFGNRFHPYFREYKPHQGIDITGPEGSSIYATGDGVVVKRNFERGGYGNYVVIEHGFGYQTLYAHLKGALVLEGQKVSRGERIGLLGNTGLSMAPHVHYEVIHRGVSVNPFHYFSSDIGSDEYDILVGAVRSLRSL